MAPARIVAFLRRISGQRLIPSPQRDGSQWVLVGLRVPSPLNFHADHEVFCAGIPPLCTSEVRRDYATAGLSL